MMIITIKRDVNTSKLTLLLVSRDTTSAEITRTDSKNPVQKRHLVLCGVPCASKKTSYLLRTFGSRTCSIIEVLQIMV